MPPFPKPAFAYSYDLRTEVTVLRAWRKGAPGRQIPCKGAQRLLVAT